MNDPHKALRLVSPTANPPAEGTAAGSDASASGAKSFRSTGIVARPVPDGVCPKCGAAQHFGAAVPLSPTFCTACGSIILVPGQLDGFLVVERIGEGAMGKVYRARDEALKRDVAIKIVHIAHDADEQQAERLRQEARAAASISHPHVAQVHALGFSNNHPYLVMELVHGVDMDARLRRERMIDERVALRVAGEIADGLCVLHRRGLTHGDIKPANIVLDEDGRAKLVDFGLSGMARHDGSGAIHGTPHYIAPELLRGAADSSQTDLYSLGATLYHLLAGKPPFTGRTPAEVVRARLEGPPDPLGRHNPHLSAGTQRLVMRLLAVDPAQRYPDCAAVLADLKAQLRLLDAPVAPPHQEAPGSAVLQRASRRRRRAGQVVLVAVALVEAAVLINMRRGCGASHRAAPSAGATNGTAMAAAVPRLPVPDRPVFTRRIEPNWFSINLGASVRGSTVSRQNAVIVLSDGTALMQNSDDCRYVHTGVTGDFSFAAELGVTATTDPDALTGLLVRLGRETDAPSLFFGLQGDGRLVLYRRERGRSAKSVKRAESSSFLPCRLRIVRQDTRFLAEVSGDGTTWQPFAECTLKLGPTVRVGLAVTSHLSGTMATAEFRDLELLVP
jgi:tRNA A-37 threonylcarbamoyl transferase component Bud32